MFLTEPNFILIKIFSLRAVELYKTVLVTHVLRLKRWISIESCRPCVSHNKRTDQVLQLGVGLLHVKAIAH